MTTTKCYTELFKIIAGSTGKNRHLRKLVYIIENLFV